MRESGIKISRVLTIINKFSSFFAILAFLVLRRYIFKGMAINIGKTERTMPPCVSNGLNIRSTGVDAKDIKNTIIECGSFMAA